MLLVVCSARLGVACYLPSRRLTFLTSALEVTTSAASRRVRVEDLPSSRWRRLACSRRTLPVPLRRNRFLVPLCVFIFGIGTFSSVSSRGGASRAADWRSRRGPGGFGRWCRSCSGRLFGGRCLGAGGGRRGRCLGAGRRGRLGRRRSDRIVAPGPVGCLLGPGVGLLLRRPENHDHVPPLLLRRGLDEPELLDVGSQP